MTRTQASQRSPTTDNSTPSDKLRGLSLAVLMVLSVFAGVASISGTAAAANEPTNLSIDRPSAGNTPLYLGADDNDLQVGYSYEDANPSETTVELVDSSGTTQLETIFNDSKYSGDGSTKAVTLSVSNLPDGEYNVRVQTTDASGNSKTVTLNRPIVRDATPPAVTSVSLRTSRVRPNGTVDVTYSYSEANPNVSFVTLVPVDGDDPPAVFELNDSKNYPGDGSDRTKTLNLSTKNLTEGKYEVYFLARDKAGNKVGPTKFDNLSVDADSPTVTSVDVEIGSDKAYVVFSEPVASTDGRLDATDFTYTNANDAGVSAIESVEFVDENVAELTLDQPVTEGDVGADTVGIREGVVADQAGRLIAATEVTVTDTTSPKPPIIDAAGTTNFDGIFPVTQANTGSYPVTVVVTEPENGGTLNVALAGPGGTVESASTPVEAGQSVYTLTINASTLNDGNIDVVATYEEPSGQTSSRTVFIPKDTTSPTVERAKSNADVREASVTFSEPVRGVTPNTVALSGIDASVVAVEQVTETTYTLELDADVPESAIGSATVEVDPTGVTDAFGNPVASAGASATIQRTTVVDAVAANGTVTVTVSATAETSPSGSAERINSVLTATDQLTFQDGFSTELAAADFQTVTSGNAYVYEATFDAPSDGAYAVTTSSGTDTVAVDQEEPHPIDAAILDVTAAGDADGERSTTRLRVRFNEPIDASNIDPADVSIEGFDGNVIEVVPMGTFGAIEVYVGGHVQTGTEPNVTVAPSSYTERAGDRSPGLETKTTLHTTKLHLDAGMNFVSVPAASGDLPLSELNTSAVDIVWMYDAETEQFRSWDPDAAENDFTALKGGYGYLFVMEEPATLDVNVYNQPGVTNGSEVAPAPNEVQLYEGYNLVGHYQEDDQSVSAAFQSLERGTPFKVLAQAEGSAGLEYQSYDAGDFEKLETGEAYWIFVQKNEVYAETPFGVVRVLDLYDIKEAE